MILDFISGVDFWDQFYSQGSVFNWSSLTEVEVDVLPQGRILLAEERFENVQRSLYDFIQNGFTLSVIDFEGSDGFDSSDVNDWVWIGVSSKTNKFMRQTSPGRLGDLTRFILHTVIYLKPTDDLSRKDRIADDLENLLRRASVPITDYVGGGGVIGQAVGQGVVGDRLTSITIPGSAKEDIRPYLLDFEFLYLKEYLE